MHWKNAWKLRKRVAHPFEQKPEKNNEVLTLPTTPLPKLFANTYLFEQKSEKNNEITTLPPSAVVTTTTDSSQVKPFVLKAKSVMDARVAKKKSWKKGQPSKTVKQKHWKNECNQKTKTIIE